MGEVAYLPALPACDICMARGKPRAQAQFDGKTVHGPWAYMCTMCFGIYGTGLGTGRGQRLLVRE